MSESSVSLEGALVGYVASLQEGDAWQSGLLVLDMAGDPQDFAHTDPVKVNALTRALFGAHIHGYIVGKLQAGPLVQAVGVKPTLMCFDEPTLLTRKFSLGIPVAILAPTNTAVRNGRRELGIAAEERLKLKRVWFSDGESSELAKAILTELASQISGGSAAEPFERVRQALRALRSGGRTK